MHVTQLNIDVLANVCKFLGEKSDILSVSLTCSSAHAFAVRWLLLTRPVHLKSGPPIHRFHSFIFAHPPARAPYLRTLYIDLRHARPSAHDSSLLVEILTLCNNIKHLTVAFQKASWPTTGDPRFFKALHALSGLRSFDIRGESTDALGLLPQVPTSVRALGLHSSDRPAAPRLPAVLEQFFPRGLMQTLEELKLDQFTVDIPDGIGLQSLENICSPSVLNMAQYPAVRSLSVESLHGRPLLHILQRIFPALDGTLSLGGFGMGHGEERHYDILREANRRSQEIGVDGVSHAWKKLDRFVCDAHELYILGLRCPIRLVMIEHALMHEKGRYLAHALRENPIPRLKLSTLHDLGPPFGELFSPELSDALTHLTLCLSYSSDYESNSPSGDGGELEWDRVLEDITSAIKPLHELTHLHIVIGVSVYVHEDMPWPVAPRGEYAHAFRESTFNWEGTASALARALPSLHNILLTTNGFLSNWDNESPAGRGWKPYERWHIAHGWRVVASSSGADGASEEEHSLVRLHDNIVETIIVQEELVLSKFDEARLHLNYGWGDTPPPLSVP